MKSRRLLRAPDPGINASPNDEEAREAPWMNQARRKGLEDAE
jgi:hypothetical protein